MKKKQSEEAPAKQVKAKPAPKLGPDKATFGGPIVLRKMAGKAKAAELQAQGWRKLMVSGDQYVMGADAHTAAKHRAGK